MSEFYTSPTHNSEEQTGIGRHMQLVAAECAIQTISSPVVDMPTRNRIVKLATSAQNYIPHVFEDPPYQNSSAFLEQGRQLLRDAHNKDPAYEVGKRTFPRKDHYAEVHPKVKAAVADNVNALQDDALKTGAVSGDIREVSSSIALHTIYAIANTAQGANRAAYRERRDEVTATLPTERWQLEHLASIGGLSLVDAWNMKNEVEQVSRRAELPNFFTLEETEQQGITDELSRDAFAIAAFADQHNILDHLQSLRPNVLIKPVRELLQLHQTHGDPIRALEEYFTFPRRLPQIKVPEVMPITDLQPNQAVRLSRSLLTREKFSGCLREVLLSAGIQLCQRYGDYHELPRFDPAEWAEQDPVSKMAAQYFGNFRQTILQAAPMSLARAREVIPAWGAQSVPPELTRRYFVTALAKMRGVQPLPRAIETFIYVRQSADKQRTHVAIASGSLLEGTQVVDAITRARNVVGQPSDRRGMLTLTSKLER